MKTTMSQGETVSHTPGPWKLDSTNVVAKDGTIVIDKGSILWNYGQGQSNARLIAAAPDLLTLAKEIRSWLVCPDLSRSVIEAYQHDCEIAISKAEGKTTL